MTTIAFDGKTLAADKQISFGGLPGTTNKLHLIHGMLIAGTGSSALIGAMIYWIANGADRDKFPAQQRDEKECASILVVFQDGSLNQYENTPDPITVLNKQWAIGSGRDFALAAMHLGKTAVEAVEIACLFDTNSGQGVDYMTLEAAAV